MKVYHLPDLDGLTEAIVAAGRLEEAAEALGISARTMRERGWHAVKGATAAPARKEPGKPLYRSIIGGAGPWTRDHAEARGRAARAAVRAHR
jgi:hypothetical protein